MTSFFRVRWYTQFDTATFDTRPFSLTVVRLLNLRCGLPHFLISRLTVSPVFTIFLPHRKLSADTFHDRTVSTTLKSKPRLARSDFLDMVNMLGLPGSAE